MVSNRCDQSEGATLGQHYVSLSIANVSAHRPRRLPFNFNPFQDSHYAVADVRFEALHNDVDRVVYVSTTPFHLTLGGSTELGLTEALIDRLPLVIQQPTLDVRIVYTKVRKVKSGLFRDALANFSTATIALISPEIASIAKASYALMEGFENVVEGAGKTEYLLDLGSSVFHNSYWCEGYYAVFGAPKPTDYEGLHETARWHVDQNRLMACGHPTKPCKPVRGISYAVFHIELSDRYFRDISAALSSSRLWSTKYIRARNTATGMDNAGSKDTVCRLYRQAVLELTIANEFLSIDTLLLDDERTWIHEEIAREVRSKKAEALERLEWEATVGVRAANGDC